MFNGGVLAGVILLRGRKDCWDNGKDFGGITTTIGGNIRRDNIQNIRFLLTLNFILLNPYAAKDHQFYNAQFLVEKNLAWLMREKEINKEKVLAMLDEDLSAKSKGLIGIVEKEGSYKIAQYIKSI